MVFTSKLKIVIDLRHVDFTFRASNHKAEETRKPCFFLPFVILNLEIGTHNLDAKENNST